MIHAEIQLLQELIEQDKEPVLLCAPTGEIRYANRRASQLLARCPKGLFATLSESPHLQVNGCRFELQERPLNSPQLRWFTISTNNAELTAENEQVNDRSDENLQAVVKELAEKNYELDNFIHRASHDIRAPLTTLLGLIDLMRNLFLHNPEMLKEHFENMETSIKKLDRHVISMLDYLKASRSPRRIEPIDIENLLDECLADLKYLPNFPRVRISYLLSEKNITFRSDPVRLRIMLRNLISNAINYANVYKNDNRLEIAVEITPEKAVFVVKDNGIGIKPELTDKVFDMFFRATAQSTGSGLGLYIVKQTVERMGGEIQMQTEYGQGSTFTLILPNHQD